MREGPRDGVPGHRIRNWLRSHLFVKRAVRLVRGDCSYERLETVPHGVGQLLERRRNRGVQDGRRLGRNGCERAGAAAHFPQQEVQLVGHDMHFLHRKILQFPIVLMGRDYWTPFVAMCRAMIDAGTISAADLDLMLVTDSVPEAMAHLELHAIQSFGLKKRKVRASKMLGEKQLAE